MKYCKDCEKKDNGCPGKLQTIEDNKFVWGCYDSSMFKEKETCTFCFGTGISHEEQGEFVPCQSCIAGERAGN